MAGHYRIIEGITEADIAFQVRAQSIDELFRYSGEALLSLMINNPDAVERKVYRAIRLTEDDMELLLFEFLNEMLYFKDAERLFLAPETVSITANAPYELICTATGETIDPVKHDLNIDVKAVTMHRLTIEHSDEGWKCIFVVDV